MRHVLPAVGVGLVVGAGTAMIAHHLFADNKDDKSDKIDKLLASVAELKQEWKEFKEKYEGSRVLPELPGAGAHVRHNSGFISIHASSDDESEWFEEAFDE